MRFPLAALDRRLDRLAYTQVVALSVTGVLLVGAVDYLTGYQISMSVFYLGPVAMAAWYAGRRAGAAIAVQSCLTWYVADLAAGNPYAHAAIPVWNALVRMVFLIVTAELLVALRSSLRRLHHLARTDGLTGLYERRAFEDRLAHDLALAQRRHEALTLAYVDVDDFRAVNAARGHAGGDRVLKAIGRALQASVRETDTAARVGGDEFALVFPGADAAGAHQIVAKLALELREALGVRGVGVTCSIGVVTFPDPAMSPAQAVAAADEVMYQVKRRGKDAVEFRVWGEPVPHRDVPGRSQRAAPPVEVG